MVVELVCGVIDLLIFPFLAAGRQWPRVLQLQLSCERARELRE